MRSDQELYFKIIAGCIALAAVVAGVIWLFEQWWFIPFCIGFIVGVAVSMIGFFVWSQR